MEPVLFSFFRTLGPAFLSDFEEAEGEQQQEEDEVDDVTCTCQFCGKYDPSFTDEKLDMHYWQNCPMLQSCHECGQVRESVYSVLQAEHVSGHL